MRKSDKIEGFILIPENMDFTKESAPGRFLFFECREERRKKSPQPNQLIRLCRGAGILPPIPINFSEAGSFLTAMMVA